MKLSNFKFDRIMKRRYWDQAYASIDVTTGWWIFKTTKTHDIESTMVGGDILNWKFVETGCFTPGNQVEVMYDEYCEAVQAAHKEKHAS